MAIMNAEANDVGIPVGSRQASMVAEPSSSVSVERFPVRSSAMVAETPRTASGEVAVGTGSLERSSPVSCSPVAPRPRLRPRPATVVVEEAMVATSPVT